MAKSMRQNGQVDIIIMTKHALSDPQASYRPFKSSRLASAALQPSRKRKRRFPRQGRPNVRSAKRQARIMQSDTDPAYRSPHSIYRVRVARPTRPNFDDMAAAADILGWRDSSSHNAECSASKTAGVALTAPAPMCTAATDWRAAGSQAGVSARMPSRIATAAATARVVVPAAAPAAAPTRSQPQAQALPAQRHQPAWAALLTCIYGAQQLQSNSLAYTLAAVLPLGLVLLLCVAFWCVGLWCWCAGTWAAVRGGNMLCASLADALLLPLHWLAARSVQTLALDGGRRPLASYAVLRLFVVLVSLRTCAHLEAVVADLASLGRMAAVGAAQVVPTMTVITDHDTQGHAPTSVPRVVVASLLGTPIAVFVCTTAAIACAIPQAALRPLFRIAFTTIAVNGSRAALLMIARSCVVFGTAICNVADSWALACGLPRWLVPALAALCACCALACAAASAKRRTASHATLRRIVLRIFSSARSLQIGVAHVWLRLCFWTVSRARVIRVHAFLKHDQEVHAFLGGLGQGHVADRLSSYSRERAKNLFRAPIESATAFWGDTAGDGSVGTSGIDPICNVCTFDNSSAGMDFASGQLWSCTICGSDLPRKTSAPLATDYGAPDEQQGHSLDGIPHPTLAHKMAQLREALSCHHGPSFDGAAFEKVPLQVSRTAAFELALEPLLAADVQQLVAGVHVSFATGLAEAEVEAGVDAGGLTTAWFEHACEDLVHAAEAAAAATTAATKKLEAKPPLLRLSSVVGSGEPMFHALPDGHLMLAQSMRPPLVYAGLGRMLGMALVHTLRGDGVALPLPLSAVLLKFMAGEPIVADDVAALDPEYFRNRMELMLRPGGVQLMCDVLAVSHLFFTSNDDDESGGAQAPLVPGGESKVVTEANKQEYVTLLAEFYVCGRAREHLTHFLGGFHELVPLDLLCQCAVNAKDLGLLLCGVPQLDPCSWQENSKTLKSASANDDVGQWFWQAVRAMSQEHQAKLLQFWYGASRLPVGGFAALDPPMTLQLSEHVHTSALPTSHTCTNELVLPLYETKQLLVDKLTLAILETHSFELR